MRNLKKVAIFIGLIAFITTIAGVKSQPTPNIFVTPDPYEAASVGEVFDINVNISDAVGLFAWEIKLRFDPAILRISAVQSGGFLAQFNSTFPLQFSNQSNFGYIIIGETMAVQDTAEGNGTLVIATFKVLRGGRGTLHLYDTLLYDIDLLEITHTTGEDGDFILNMLTLNPSKGTAAFIIEGYGFRANTTISEVTWNDEQLITLPGNIETDFRGNFIAMATVPESSLPGNFTVLARDGTGEHAEATFTLLSIEGPPGPTGAQGEQGEQGSAGPTGPAGPAGPGAPLEYSLAAILLSIIAIVIAIYALRK